MILSLVGSEAVTFSTVKLLQVVVRIVVARLVQAGVISGSSTVTGLTLGAAGGSFIGPIGSVVTGIIGLIAGIMVDWYFESDCQADISQKVEKILSEIEKTLWIGSPEQGWLGLVNILSQANISARKCVEEGTVNKIHQFISQIS